MTISYRFCPRDIRRILLHYCNNSRMDTRTFCEVYVRYISEDENETFPACK